MSRIPSISRTRATAHGRESSRKRNSSLGITIDVPCDETPKKQGRDAKNVKDEANDAQAVKPRRTEGPSKIHVKLKPML
eukprot:6196359-Pleurochrysis_carterae.AAC.5